MGGAVVLPHGKNKKKKKRGASQRTAAASEKKKTTRRCPEIVATFRSFTSCVCPNSNSTEILSHNQLETKKEIRHKEVK